MTVMKKVSTLFMSLALATAMVLTSFSASADHRRPKYKSHNHDDLTPALVGGAVGLATGLIIGNSIGQNSYRYGYSYYPRRTYYPQRTYKYTPRTVYQTRPVVRYVPEPVYHYGPPAPWTPAWYDYCSAKYRSFDRESGTFQPYSGPRKFCR